jgi:nicotinamidase-related amidase
MAISDTALVVIDAQESFRQRPYWTDQGARLFFDRLQALIDGAKKSGIPIVQVFHVEEDGVFSLASGHVKTLQEISITPDILFRKTGTVRWLAAALVFGWWNIVSSA